MNYALSSEAGIVLVYHQRQHCWMICIWLISNNTAGNNSKSAIYPLPLFFFMCCIRTKGNGAARRNFFMALV